MNGEDSWAYQLTLFKFLVTRFGRLGRIFNGIFWYLVTLFHGIRIPTGNIALSVTGASKEIREQCHLSRCIQGCAVLPNTTFNNKIIHRRIDVANRIHNYSPSTERLMHATVRYDGTVRQFRLFRLHVNMATDSKFYPYDIQKPSIKLQSLDYGADVISITSKACFNDQCGRSMGWLIDLVLSLVWSICRCGGLV